MKYILSLIVAVWSPYMLAAQIGALPTLENFKQAMKATSLPSDQLDTMLTLSNSYIFVSTDTCLILAKKGAKLAESSYRGQTVHARSMLILADAYRINNELALAEELYIEGRALHLSLGNEGKAALADNKLGALNKERGNYEEAIQYYVSALEIWERVDDTINIYKPYINMAEVFYLLGRPQKAHEYNAKALEIAERRRKKTYCS